MSMTEKWIYKAVANWAISVQGYHVNLVTPQDRIKFQYLLSCNVFGLSLSRPKSGPFKTEILVPVFYRYVFGMFKKADFVLKQFLETILKDNQGTS